MPRGSGSGCLSYLLVKAGRLVHGLAASSRSDPRAFGYMQGKATLWTAGDHRHAAAMDVAMPVAPAP